MTHPDGFGELEVTVRATIRPCRETDLPALEWMGLFSRHRATIRRTFEAQERGEALMLIAVASGFPIAQVWIRFDPDTPSGAALWAVRTFHPLQGAGIGRQMMRAAECALRRRGINRAELEVEAGDRDVLDFYRKLGWLVERGPEGRGDPPRFLLTKQIGSG